MHRFSLFFAHVLLYLSTMWKLNNATSATNKLPKGFSIDLIHRDSPLSPFYNSSMTRSERAQNAALRSISRANRFSQFSTAVETDIIPNGAEYLMKISVGNPPVERWAEVDTGSDLIWFQCSPCTQCNPQNAPFYDPTSSSTYMSLSCSSDSCKALPQDLFQGQEYPKCGTAKECMYYYAYADDSYTVGELATESISFGTTSNNGNNSQVVSFPNTVFGCGHNNNATTYGFDTGIVGLGQGNLSLISQLSPQIGRKFSDCLPLDSKASAKLRFGEEANVSGNGVVSTPMITNPNDPTPYYLSLEGITVGEERVQIDETNRNILIDSGTTLTYIPSSIYEEVEALVKKAIGADQCIVQIDDYNLCYRNAKSIKNFPNFEVHFTGGANISLKPQNLFILVTNDVVCFAVFPTNGDCIYGNVAQIDFEVEYDLDHKQVSFAAVDCTK